MPHPSTDRADPGLSRRGRSLLAHPPMDRYLHEHFERFEDGWDPSTNPDGYIGLCVAENKLGFHLLAPKLAAGRDIPPDALGYDIMIGSQRFRTQLARFLGRRLTGRPLAPEQLAVLSGGGSVLELLFYALADPGDGVLIPTPSYAGFWADLETRNRLTVVPVPTASDAGFRLHPDLLDRALAAAEVPVRALLFTSPDNPLGRVYAPAQVEEVMTWAESRGIHLVVDEVFALSVYGEVPFVSAGSLRPSLGDSVHLVWAFSKDFGVSGLRCGVLVTENQAVLEAVDQLAYWACCSGDTQHVLGTLVSDDEWVDGYLAANRALLGESYRATTAALADIGVAYLEARAGFFVLCDFRPFLSGSGWAAEEALWERLLTEANVNLTPGSSCRIAEPGFMRLCFASEPVAAVVEGVRRIGGVISSP